MGFFFLCFGQNQACRGWVSCVCNPHYIPVCSPESAPEISLRTLPPKLLYFWTQIFLRNPSATHADNLIRWVKVSAPNQLSPITNLIYQHTKNPAPTSISFRLSNCLWLHMNPSISKLSSGLVISGPRGGVSLGKSQVLHINLFFLHRLYRPGVTSPKEMTCLNENPGDRMDGHWFNRGGVLRLAASRASVLWLFFCECCTAGYNDCQKCMALSLVDQKHNHGRPNFSNIISLFRMGKLGHDQRSDIDLMRWFVSNYVHFFMSFPSISMYKTCTPVWQTQQHLLQYPLCSSSGNFFVQHNPCCMAEVLIGLGRQPSVPPGRSLRKCTIKSVDVELQFEADQKGKTTAFLQFQIYLTSDKELELTRGCSGGMTSPSYVYTHGLPEQTVKNPERLLKVCQKCNTSVNRCTEEAYWKFTSWIRGFTKRKPVKFTCVYKRYQWAMVSCT